MCGPRKQLQLRREETASSKGWQEELDEAAVIGNPDLSRVGIVVGAAVLLLRGHSTLDSLESRCEQLFLGRRRKAVTWMLGLSGQSWATRLVDPHLRGSGPGGAEGLARSPVARGRHSSSRGSSYERWQLDV